jgi:MFS family permease
MSETALPKNYRRNFWSLVLDLGFFGLGMSFISQNTVIPSFLTTIGASSAFIGLVSSLQSASWLLPQLIAARSLSNKPYKKPHILWPAAIGRFLLLLMALAIWLTGAQPKWLIMLLTAGVVIGFWVGDGVASVAWLDLLSKAIPPRRRGRLTSTGQVFSGTLGFAAGAAVEWMLSDRGPAYPHSYALLFLLGFAMMALSFCSVCFLVEERGASTHTNPSWREYLPQLWTVLKEDRVFRRLIIARQLTGLGGLAIPFYMPYALEKLGLPAQVAGRYTSIGVLGSILAALAYGWVNERYGSKRVLQIGIAMGTVAPLAAWLVPRWITNPDWLAWGYGLVFLCLSGMMSSMMPGWMNYVLEWAPDANRPMYVGLTNTLNGVATLFATLGGLILQWTDNNYQMLFAITIAGLFLAWPLPFWLPEPRHRSSI